MLLLKLLLLFGITVSSFQQVTEHEGEDSYYQYGYLSTRTPGLPCKVISNNTIDCMRRELTEVPPIPAGTFSAISLNSNNISAVANNSFITHPDLVRVELEDNFINTIDILAFRGLYNLTELYLRSNMLHFISSKAFEYLISLQTLSLVNNLFYATPEDALSKLPALTVFEFELHGTSLFTLENVKSPFEDMEHLILSGYKREVLHLSNESFVNTPNLNTFYLYCEAFAESNTYTPLIQLITFNMICSKLDHLHSITHTLQSLTLFFAPTCGGTPIKEASTDSLKPLHKFQILEYLKIRQEILSIKDNAFSWGFKLTTLDIGNNNIEYISPGAFNNLTSLQILILKENSLTGVPFQALQVFGLFAALTSLDLSSNNIGLNPIGVNHSHPFGMSRKLTNINLDSNAISDNFFVTHFIINNPMILSISNNPNLLDFNIVLEKFPNINAFKLDTNPSDITEIPDGIRSATLQILVIHIPIQFFLYEINIDFTLLRRLPSLQSLKISNEGTHFWRLTIKGNLQNSTSITSITLDNISLTSKDFKTIFSGSFLDLTNLQLTRNLLTYIPPEIFKATPNILSLDLSFNAISVVDTATMAPLKKLQNLRLLKNRIYEIDFLQHVLKTLINLDLGQNAITKIPQDIFTDASNLEFVNLAGNPFACTCTSGVTYFKNWFYNDKVTEVATDDSLNYLCATPTELSGVVVTQVHLFCPSWLLTKLCPCLAAFVLLVLIVFLTVKYRWRIRYKLFKLLHQRKYQEYIDDDNNIEEQPQQRHFDAYVAYHKNDKDWVLDELIKNMENEYLDAHGETHQIQQPHGEKIVLHIPERDLQVGQPRVRAVTEAIQSSTKTVIILSQSFMQSEWCYFQMQVAFERLFSEGRDVIILILLEDIPYHNMLRELRKMLRRKSYLRWPDNAVGQELFWIQLRDKMRKPVRVDRRYEI